MIVYHYARLDNWWRIKESNNPGLVVNQRLSELDHAGRQIVAIFGLLEPTPDEWTKNIDFPNIWNKFRANVGKLMLELDIPTNTAYIADWGHREGVLIKDKSRLPQRYKHETELDAERAYVKSLVSLEKYLANRSEFPYSIPEVVITKNISIDKIHISKQQPLLEYMMEHDGGGEYVKRRIREINQIPELQPWYKDYVGRRGINPEKLS